jgi:hypothetical protein
LIEQHESPTIKTTKDFIYGKKITKKQKERKKESADRETHSPQTPLEISPKIKKAQSKRDVCLFLFCIETGVRNFSSDDFEAIVRRSLEESMERSLQSLERSHRNSSNERKLSPEKLKWKIKKDENKRIQNEVNEILSMEIDEQLHAQFENELDELRKKKAFLANYKGSEGSLNKERGRRSQKMNCHGITENKRSNANYCVENIECMNFKMKGRNDVIKGGNKGRGSLNQSHVNSVHKKKDNRKLGEDSNIPNQQYHSNQEPGKGSKTNKYLIATKASKYVHYLFQKHKPPQIP